MDAFLCFIVFLEVLVLFKSVDGETIYERDAKLSTPQMIAEHGYPREVHRVKTEDGYILELHRIAAPGRRPIFLMHGMLDSSATWVLLGPDKALGYLLYHLGYDVWLGNARGNTYSQGHVKYKRNGWRDERQRYWNFSWHEIGKYDLPASIDYIVGITGFPKIHYIGHSQGTTSFFVMMSERPEYNEKILFMTALAPPVFMGNVKIPLLQLNIRNLDTIEAITDLIGFFDFSKETNAILVHAQHSALCYLESLKYTQLCNNNFSPIVGNITDHVNREILPMLETHLPAGASMKQVYHYGQLIRSHRFCQFDYGSNGNLNVYGRSTPPSYNLRNCTTTVGIIYADADTLAASVDVIRLPRELPNVIGIHRVNDGTFNHVDFIWASDAKELVYDYLIDWMRTMEDRENQQNQPINVGSNNVLQEHLLLI